MKFLIGCWTFLDADKPSQMRAHWLDLNGVGALSEIADAPKSVYYGAVEPGGQSMLLLRNDMHRSAMSRQTIHADGILTETGHWRCGENGVDEGGSYIAFDQTGAYFAVANSAVGWVIYRNGATPEAIADLCHEGSGPHPRQAHSHPHCVIFSPDNRWIYAADMGADAVLAFPFDAATGRVGEKIIAHRTTPGAGPRHLLFHHGLVYLLNELGNALEVLAPNADGTLTALQKVATMPED
ncbi:MAG: beta-propeller fold lactonase family protein, partial [Alphaproteobacteria bacterium]|nr:beta-propeller fold lactonase family protein [Alphaproteobacteria bacterium]